MTGAVPTAVTPFAVAGGVGLRRANQPVAVRTAAPAAPAVTIRRLTIRRLTIRMPNLDVPARTCQVLLTRRPGGGKGGIVLGIQVGDEDAVNARVRPGRDPVGAQALRILQEVVKLRAR